jgi:hypothetical protein
VKIRELIQVVKLSGPLGVDVHICRMFHLKHSLKTVVYYDTKLKPETDLTLRYRVSLFPCDNKVKIILVSWLLFVPVS